MARFSLDWSSVDESAILKDSTRLLLRWTLTASSSSAGDESAESSHIANTLPPNIDWGAHVLRILSLLVRVLEYPYSWSSNAIATGIDVLNLDFNAGPLHGFCELSNIAADDGVHSVSITVSTAVTASCSGWMSSAASSATTEDTANNAADSLQYTLAITTAHHGNEIVPIIVRQTTPILKTSRLPLGNWTVVVLVHDTIDDSETIVFLQPRAVVLSLEKYGNTVQELYSFIMHSASSMNRLEVLNKATSLLYIQADDASIDIDVKDVVKKVETLSRQDPPLSVTEHHALVDFTSAAAGTLRPLSQGDSNEVEDTIAATANLLDNTLDLMQPRSSSTAVSQFELSQHELESMLLAIDRIVTSSTAKKCSYLEWALQTSRATWGHLLHHNAFHQAQNLEINYVSPDILNHRP